MYNKVITIGREFGSGGHEIGERLSKALEIPLYDRNLVEMASKVMGVDEFSLEQVDETALRGFLATYQIPDLPNSVTGYGLPLNDSMFLAQSNIIDKLAKTGPCVIIGRCGDYILRENPLCINIFICASKEDRQKRIMERYQLTEREAADAVRRVDRKRKSYYETYTDKKWGDIQSHQLLVNVSLLGMDQAAELIKQLYLATPDTCDN